MDIKGDNMTVKEILTNVAYLLDDTKLITAIESDTFSGNTLTDRNLLVKCVNYINNIIATEYFHVEDEVEVYNYTGVVGYKEISSKTIFDIVEVRSSFDNKINFKILPNGVETKKGKLKIKYLYMPEEVGYDDKITCYPTKMNERIFAYGVASEFLFIKGNFDEGDIWDTRFKNGLASLRHNHREMIMPNRRWS